MKNAIKILIPLIILFVIQCNYKSQSQSEKFHKHLDKNISACADIYIKQGVDSLIAYEYCECILNTLFENDSSFIDLQGDELTNYINKMRESTILEKCDSMLIKDLNN